MTPSTIKYRLPDAAGVLVAVHCREDRPDRPDRPKSKSVWFEQLDGTKGLGGLKATDLPLYGIALDIVQRASTVVLCEGEKTADALIAAGIPAVGTVAGAGVTPGPEALAELTGKDVVLWPDNDGVGREHMDRNATGLAGVEVSVRRLEWSEAPEGGDAADFLFPDKGAAELHQMAEAVAGGQAAYRPSGHSLEELEALFEGAEAFRQPPTETKERRAPKGPTSQGSQLVALVDEGTLFHTTEGEPYATLPLSADAGTGPEPAPGPEQTVALRSRAMKGFLRVRYMKQYGVAPGRNAVDEALEQLEAIATIRGPEAPVFVRLAEHKDGLYIDLGDRSGRAIHVTAESWMLVDRPGVHFRRSPNMAALPEPESGGSITQLGDFLHLADDGGASFRRIVGYILACLRPAGPYPVLGIRGEHGSAKTTTSRIVVALVDPNTVPVRRPPKDEESLRTAAYHHHLVAIDNVSRLPDWLSDDLSQLATGWGSSTRQKYTDLDEIGTYLRRPVILNGIEEFVTSPDLVDRTWVVELPALPDKRDEDDFWADFERARPRLLGGVLDALVAARAGLAGVRLSTQTRMVGAARFVVAAEQALGWPAGAFERELAEMSASSRASTLEASPLTDLLVELLKRGAWQGTAEELLRALRAAIPEERREVTLKRRDWPTTPRGLGGRLRRLAPDLRQERGIEVAFGDRQAGSGRRLIVVRKVSGETTVTTVTPVTPSLFERDGAAPTMRSTVTDPGATVTDQSRGRDGRDGSVTVDAPYRHTDFVLEPAPCDGCDGSSPLSRAEEEEREDGESRSRTRSAPSREQPGGAGYLVEEDYGPSAYMVDDSEPPSPQAGQPEAEA